jgi:hypothetical protein
MGRKQSEETKAFLANLRKDAKIRSVERKKIYINPEDRVRREEKGKTSSFQDGGQFAPENERKRLKGKMYTMGRGYGWSEETIMKREGITDEDICRPYSIVEEILSEGHGVKTRAPNICLKCNRKTEAGEIVLGVVHGGYGTGGSERYYICKDCARKELEERKK